ncbi:hypothetical protein [Aureivirga sp. CE67]|uniref:hypothetical protein n=1 Tax=Aureivirga sp. CE67 TaxID=1788983 RepID=UPI0018C92A84|nr:hypothetical protein [Aureivirga sp. CE67]
MKRINTFQNNIYKIFTLVLILIISSSCEEPKKASPKPETAEITTPSCGAPCGVPEITWNLPNNTCVGSIPNQEVINCFAWTNFIALNWESSNIRGVADTLITANNFGNPGNLRPTVWESFLQREDVFRDSPPENWNNINTKDYVKSIKSLGELTEKLSQIPDNKILPTDESLRKLKSVLQAGSEAFLIDQDTSLVWYEVKMNHDEYKFIMDNKLYDYPTQREYANKNNGIWLPSAGTDGFEQGAMQLKASWKIIPDTKFNKLKKYYKISKAMVPSWVKVKDLKGKRVIEYGPMKEVYLGLVGLHIVRKIQPANQFVWMTFEHDWNAPTENAKEEEISNAMKENGGYNFYNKDSKQPINTISDSLNIPSQIVRIQQNAIPKDVEGLNAYVKQLISQTNSNSVWQYYQLISVQWPESPVSSKFNDGRNVPLQTGAITPVSMANVTLESFTQTQSCMTCHKYASIHLNKMDASKFKTDVFASDYNFMFSEAEYNKPKTDKK